MAAPAPAETEPGREGVGGERRRATILLSDLCGYTSLNEAFDPETIEEIVSRIKSIAKTVLPRYGGFVNQFVGDEVVALFGFPAALENDQLAALRAALAFHAALKPVSDEVSGRIGRDVAMHSAIATGLSVFQRDDERAGLYSVTGDTINTASRILARAGAGEILVVGDVKRRAEAEFEFETLEPLLLKGKASPLPVWRALHARSGTSGRPSEAPSRPFIGRTLEMAQLRQSRDRAMAGRGQVVAVIAPDGYGKSRLVRELLRTAPAGEMTVMEGSCLSSGMDTPYLPYLGILRRAFGIEDNEPLASLQAKVIDGAQRLGDELAQHLPALLHLLSAEHPDHPLPENCAGEALARAQQTAISMFFGAASNAEPLLLVLEDWHWVDKASDQVLRRNLDRIAGRPIMIVVSMEMRAEISWPTLSHLSIVNLGPFDEAGTEMLLRTMLGVSDVPAEFTQMLCHRTGGSPLFMEEIAKALLEDGVIQLQYDELVVATTLPTLGLPDTVQSAVLRRLDRIESDRREVLRRASVIGSEFPFALLDRLMGAGFDLAGTLAKLEALEFIVQVRDEPDLRYAFRHTITREVAYETLLLKQRREWHRATARGIEQIYSERIEEYVEALSFHFLRAEDSERAAHYLVRAGDKANATFALEAARAHYLGAIRIADSRLERQGERSKDLLSHRVELSLKWAAASQFAATASHIEALERSLAIALELGAPQLEAEVRYWIGRMAYTIGASARGIEEFEKSLAQAEALGEQELIGRCTCALGRICLFTAESALGERYLERGIGIMRQIGKLAEVSYSTSNRACIRAFTGRFDAAEEMFADALRMTRELRHRTYESLVLQQMGYVRCLRGDWDGARSVLAECRSLAARTGNTVLAAFADIFSAYAEAHCGSRERALQELNRAMARYERTGSHLAASLCHGWAADVCAAAKDFERARIHAERSLACEKNADRFGHAPALRAESLLAFHRGDLRQADAAMRRAIEFAEKRGARPDEGICRLQWAKLLVTQGESAAAAAQRDGAARIFRESGMHWWLAEAEKTPVS